MKIYRFAPAVVVVEFTHQFYLMVLKPWVKIYWAWGRGRYNKNCFHLGFVTVHWNDNYEN